MPAQGSGHGRIQIDRSRRAALRLGEAEAAVLPGRVPELLYDVQLLVLRVEAPRPILQAQRLADPQAAVQLIAQRAKAWARPGDRRQVETALDRGRHLLEGKPSPDNLDHHFAVDPAKFDFYAMDCYRILGEDALAKIYAYEVIRTSTDFDGTERKPMRIAEARITLGVAAAREGDLTQAVALGRQALQGDRKSLPSLTMVARNLSTTLSRQYPNEPETRNYVEELRALSK